MMERTRFQVEREINSPDQMDDIASDLHRCRSRLEFSASLEQVQQRPLVQLGCPEIQSNATAGHYRSVAIGLRLEFVS